MKVILFIVGTSFIFSIGFLAGATWNYIYTINKQIEQGGNNDE